MSESRKKVPITELQIFTYQPMQAGRKYLAKIGNLPMVFKGDTAAIAKGKADAWRHEQIAKEKRAKALSAERAAARSAKKGQAHA